MRTHPSNPVDRRAFLKSAGATAGSLLILPGGVLCGQEQKPSSKLNVAFIGMGGVIDESNTAVRLCADWLRQR